MYSNLSSGRKRVGTTTAVNDASTAWVNMEPHWGLIETLLGGTYKIRKGHRKFLPQEPREQDFSYDNRLQRSVLSPYYVRLERMLAGMLTRKPVRLNDVSDVIREQLFDVDLQGNDLQTFLYDTSRICLRYGHVGVLVDAPTAGENGRPYWVSYSPRDILGWRTQIIDGQQKLMQLRLSETIIAPDGLYGEKQIEQVRVLTPGAFEIHQKNEKGDFQIVNEGRTSLSDIPFSVAYSNRMGVLESIPPLGDIAELNLQHYRVQSDLANQLHISAVPMLAIFGFPQSAEEISAGPGEAMALPEGSEAKYIEPAGNSYEAQFKQLDRIADQINALGLASVIGAKLVGETAEAKRIDRSQGDSTMMVVSQQMQDMIDNCLRFHAEYMQENNPGSCLVNRDFMGMRLTPQDIQALLQLYTAGTITQETLLLQLEAGEILGDEFNVESEIDATMAGGLLDSESLQPAPEPQAVDNATMPTESNDADGLA
ncbi:MAG: putative portal protein [Prokaryotic dsDNA virus sp.]|nr:MAG: putative portal protein [Prokaryotic dsDNA virus sp.]